MRIAGVVGLSLIMGFGFVACSSGGTGMMSDGGSGDSEAGSDATSPRDPSTKVDASKDGKADAFRSDARKAVCVSNCQSDSECAATCPPPPSGSAICCDSASGVCYASSSASCGGVDAGID